MNPDVNPYTGRPYSQRYHNILATRKTLPVWEQKDDFVAKVYANQVTILVGETGSGKTTQVSYQPAEIDPSYRSSSLDREPSCDSPAHHTDGTLMADPSISRRGRLHPKQQGGRHHAAASSRRHERRYSRLARDGRQRTSPARSSAIRLLRQEPI